MNKDELLDAYFEGSLTAQQENELKDLMEKDPSFREEMEFRKDLREALKKEERESLRSMMRGMREERSTPVRSIRRYIPSLLAAFILLLLTIGYFIVTSPVENQEIHLYAAYFEPYDNVVHPIERGNPSQDLTSRAFLAYENGKYEEAIRLFGDLSEEASDPYIDFYSGIVLLELDREDEAVQHFLSYLNSGGSLKDRAEWYLALGYLKEGKTEQAKELFSTIANRAAYKSAESQEILDELD